MKNENRCYICKKSALDDPATCAYCHTTFHKIELNNWIRRFKKCPRCGRELKEFVIVPKK
ncbi:MAG: hypothetical protein ACTSR3_13005 [Candidatus Helarchaeota archaeon]